MGAHSTLDVSRGKVLDLIHEYLEDATDEQLCDALFALAGEKSLYNYRIISETDTPLGSLGEKA